MKQCVDLNKNNLYCIQIVKKWDFVKKNTDRLHILNGYTFFFLSSKINFKVQNKYLLNYFYRETLISEPTYFFSF